VRILWLPRVGKMVLDMAMSLESFYKPELDAAHNRALRPALR
jgi:hypothetical protein